MSEPDPVGRGRRILVWTSGIIGGLLIVAVLALALLDWNALRKPISRYASARLHRPVAINGDLKVHLFSFAPRVEVDALSVGNPDWDKPGEMFQADRIEFQIKLLPLFIGRMNFNYLRIVHPIVSLHRTVAGKANWQLGPPTGKSTTDVPLKLPVVRLFSLDDGHIDINDEQRHLSVSSSLQASDHRTGEADNALQMNGTGKLNAKPFSFRLRGDSLLNVQANTPYEFDLSVNAGEINASAKGSAARAFDFGTARAQVRVSGEDLADLYYLTGLALPNTRSYEVSADVLSKGMRMDLTKISGRIGGSDLSGGLSVDMSADRPLMTGTVASRQLSLADLAAPLGAGKPAAATISAPDRKKKAGRSAPAAEPADRLLPDAPLQVNRIRGMDADVHYSAASLNTEKIPLRKFAVHVQLKNGVLTLQPLVFAFPQGAINMRARIDAREDMPHTDIDLRVTDVKLDQFSKPGTTPALAGTLQGRAKLDGPGRSVHEVAANANGSVTFVIPHGEIRQAFAELTGINVDRGLGLILFNAHETANVRCGVANFKVTRGDMSAQNVVIDTDSVLITASGNIAFDSEALNLAIKGDPKKLRLLRLRTPVLLRGHLKKPTVGIDVGKTTLQAGVAAAIGALLTPLAAVIAFVDPGLAKDANCTALLAQAQEKVDSPPPQNQSH